MTAAIARKNGWGPGTLLTSDHGPDVLRITAVGEYRILAVPVVVCGQPVSYSETTWDLSCRDWRVAE